MSDGRFRGSAGGFPPVVRSGYDELMEEVSVGWGYCGCIKDGKPLHVDVLIPAEGPVTADQFVEWVFLADNLNPSLAPESHRETLRAAFVKYMGAEVVDARQLRWSSGAAVRPEAMTQEDEERDFEEIVRKHFRCLYDLGMVAGGTRRDGGSHWDSYIVSRCEASDWRVDVAWGKAERALAVQIKYNNTELSDSERYVFFEPFVELLTDGREKAIIPYVAEGMSIASLKRLEAEREVIFAAGIEPAVEQLGRKLERFLDQVRSASTRQIKAYHTWFGRASKRDAVWYEVWSDEFPEAPYLLMLFARPGDTAFVVYDPIKDEVSLTARTYDEAREWLLEDDYRLIDGRVAL